MKIRRVDFSADEWLVGTNPLTNAERGLYITACAMIYSHAGPILRVDLKAQCRDHGKSFNCQLDRLLALGKLTVEITLNGAEISSKRCLNELEMASKRIQKASENGTKGNEIKKMRDATRPLDRDANYQLPTTTRKKDSKKLESKEDSNLRSAPRGATMIDQDFEAWWKECPRKIAKGAGLRAYRTARKSAEVVELLDGIRAYAASRAGEDAQFTTHPATWLNGKRWLDQPGEDLDRKDRPTGPPPPFIRRAE